MRFSSTQTTSRMTAPCSRPAEVAEPVPEPKAERRVRGISLVLDLFWNYSPLVRKA